MSAIAKLRITLASVAFGAAAAVALAGPVSAQDHKAPEKPAQGAPATDAPRAHPAAVQSAPAAGGNSVALAGLTRENSGAVKTALEGLTHTAWKCPGCGATQAEKGSCSMCKQELVEEQVPTLNHIALDADKGTLSFAVAPGQKLHLTELESRLSAQRVSVPREKLVLGPSSTLVVSGVPDQDAMTRLETELKNSKLFDSVSGKLVSASKQAELTVKGGATGATRSRVEAALAQAGPGYKLSDVVWTAPAGASGMAR